MKYLIVGPSWVGDMVMAQSLFLRLKQQDSSCEIDVLAPGWSLPILSRMPEVRRGIALPYKHGEFALGKLWQLGRELKAEQYDKAIILPRSFKSALVPFFAQIPERVGFSGELRTALLTDARKRRPTKSADGKQILDKTVWRYLGLGASKTEYASYQFEVPEPRMQVDQNNAEQVLAQLGLDLSRPAVCICPGAEYGPAKQWPLEYHAELAQKLVAQGKQVWVLGSDKDSPSGDVIAPESSEHCHNLCGKTKLADVIDLMGVAEAVVSHDSGLMHVAAAAGTPVVAIYGSSSPDFTPPLTEKKTIHWLGPEHGLDCSPCFARTCKFGHYNCLKQISVERVISSINNAATC